MHGLGFSASLAVFCPREVPGDSEFSVGNAAGHGCDEECRLHSSWASPGKGHRYRAPPLRSPASTLPVWDASNSPARKGPDAPWPPGPPPRRQSAARRTLVPQGPHSCSVRRHGQRMPRAIAGPGELVPHGAAPCHTLVACVSRFSKTLSEGLCSQYPARYWYHNQPVLSSLPEIQLITAHLQGNPKCPSLTPVKSKSCCLQSSETAVPSHMQLLRWKAG